MPYEFVHRFTLDGDEEKSDIPSILDLFTASRIGPIYPFNSYNYSSARVVDGDFVRLKQLSLSYTLPVARVQALGLNNLAVSLVANNMYLIYADKNLNGQDPEFFSSGGVAQPIPRQLTLSLKIGL
jgi:hypothetical protein